MNPSAVATRFPPVLLFLACLFSQSIQASVCFTPSPSKRGDMELTDEIVARNLSKQDEKIISDLLNDLDGAWTGTATEIVCKGKTDNIVEEKVEYVLNVEVNLRRDIEAKLHAELDSSEAKKSRAENMEFYLGDGRFRVNDEFTAGDVEITKLSADYISFYKKIATRTAAGGVSVREVMQTISLQDGLYFEFVVYSNGVQSAHTIWEARKTR